MIITPTLHHVPRLPNLKTLTLGDAYNYYDISDDKIEIKEWYRQFYNGLRYEYLYNNSYTHVVLKDFRMEEDLIRQDEYLGGVDIQVITNLNYLEEIDKYIIIFDKDYEWIEKNKKPFTYKFPLKLLVKILQSFPDLQEKDIYIFARLNHSTMQYIRDSFEIPFQIILFGAQFDLWSKYSIISNNNIESMSIQIEQLVIFFKTQYSNQLTDNIQNNQNNIKDMVFLPNLHSLYLRLDKEDDIPNVILLEISKLKKLDIECPGHQNKMKWDNSITVGYHLTKYFEYKSSKYNNTSNQTQHPMLRKVTLIGDKQNINIPSYITKVSILDIEFVSAIGRAANIKHITIISSLLQHTNLIIKKMVVKFNVKNQFQQLESMKFRLNSDYLNPTQIAKFVYDLVTYLGNIKSLKSFEIVFCELNHHISDVNIDKSHTFQLQNDNHQSDILKFIRK